MYEPVCEEIIDPGIPVLCFNRCWRLGWERAERKVPFSEFLRGPVLGVQSGGQVAEVVGGLVTGVRRCDSSWLSQLMSDTGELQSIQVLHCGA